VNEAESGEQGTRRGSLRGGGGDEEMRKGGAHGGGEDDEKEREQHGPGAHCAALAPIM